MLTRKPLTPHEVTAICALLLSVGAVSAAALQGHFGISAARARRLLRPTPADLEMVRKALAEQEARG